MVKYKVAIREYSRLPIPIKLGANVSKTMLSPIELTEVTQEQYEWCSNHRKKFFCVIEEVSVPRIEKPIIRPRNISVNDKTEAFSGGNLDDISTALRQSEN